MGKSLKLITVKPRYIATTFFAHTLCEQKLHLSRYLELPLQIAVNKQWILWNQLIPYALLVVKLLIPTGLAIMFSLQSVLLSISFNLWNLVYQVWGPVNCEDKKFVTHFGEWNFLILTACNCNTFYYVFVSDILCFELVSGTCSCVEGIGSAVNVSSW